MAEGLDCEKNRSPVRWPEILAEGLDCKRKSKKPSRPKTRGLASAKNLSVLKGILKDNGFFSIAAGNPESGSSWEVPRGLIRWSEILAEGLDCEKNRSPVRWPEILAEGLDCEKNRNPIRTYQKKMVT